MVDPARDGEFVVYPEAEAFGVESYGSIEVAGADGHMVKGGGGTGRFHHEVRILEGSVTLRDRRPCGQDRLGQFGHQTICG